MTDNKQNDDDFARDAALAAYRKQKEAYDRRPKTIQHMFAALGRMLTGRNMRRTLAGVMALAVGYVGLAEFGGGVNNQLVELKTPEGGSAIAEWLRQSIKRENDTGWCPSANFLHPYHLQIDRCAFQNGQREIWLRVVQRLHSEVTRAGVVNRNDPDISEVLKTVSMGDYWSPFFWLRPELSTATSFDRAVARLDSFQVRKAKGEAAFYSQIDNISSIVDDVTNVMGNEQAILRDVAGRAGPIVGPATREVTYRVLGSMNAACGLLKAMQKDFGQVIAYQSSVGVLDLTIDKVCDDIGEYPPVFNNVGGKVAQMDADMSAATNQLEALQRALAAEARQAGRSAPRPVVPGVR